MDMVWEVMKLKNSFLLLLSMFFFLISMPIYALKTAYVKKINWFEKILKIICEANDVDFVKRSSLLIGNSEEEIVAFIKVFSEKLLEYKISEKKRIFLMDLEPAKFFNKVALDDNVYGDYFDGVNYYLDGVASSNATLNIKEFVVVHIAKLHLLFSDKHKEHLIKFLKALEAISEQKNNDGIYLILSTDKPKLIPKHFLDKISKLGEVVKLENISREIK